MDYGCVCCVFKDDYFMKNDLGLTERKDGNGDPHSGRIVPPVPFDNPFYGHGWWPLCGTSSSEDDYAKPDNNVCSCLMHFMLPCIVDPLLFGLWVGTGFCCCRTLPCSSRVVSQHYVEHYPQYLTSGPAFERRHKEREHQTAIRIVEDNDEVNKI